MNEDRGSEIKKLSEELMVLKARKPVAKKNKERYARRLRARKELNIILDAVLEHFTHEKVVEYLKQYAIMQGRR